MNILYYDKNMSYEHLNDLWVHLKDKYPEDTLLFLPNSVQLLIDASAEQLLNISDQIWVALDKIREERPEEYRKAYDNRLAVIRDKQWKEAMDEARNKTKNKKPLGFLFCTWIINSSSKPYFSTSFISN
jgi:hypothetical protein